MGRWLMLAQCIEQLSDASEKSQTMHDVIHRSLSDLHALSPYHLHLGIEIRFLLRQC